MKEQSIKNMLKDWIIGDFSPSLYKTKDFELAVKSFKAGEKEPNHIHTASEEIVLVLSGKVKIQENILLTKQIARIAIGEETNFYAIEDSMCLFIKTKGINDRVWTEKKLINKVDEWVAVNKAKVRLYIVTYKRNNVLNENLKSLWNSIKDESLLDVTILANHPDVVIDQENIRKNLRVIPNYVRATNAWGNLSKDWNFAILDAFKDWTNPDGVEWCVLAQNDVKWISGWLEWLVHNKDFDFISQPVGDQAMAINIEAVKKIGFFDERFSTLHFQEQDYFTRAIYHLRERCSITDSHRNDEDTSYNPLGNVLIETSQNYINYNEPELHHYRSMGMMSKLIEEKYHIEKANDIFDRKAILEHISNIPFEKEINWYPFFWEGYKEIEDTFMYND